MSVTSPAPTHPSVIFRLEVNASVHVHLLYPFSPNMLCVGHLVSLTSLSFLKTVSATGVVVTSPPSPLSLLWYLSLSKLTSALPRTVRFAHDTAFNQKPFCCPVANAPVFHYLHIEDIHSHPLLMTDQERKCRTTFMVWQSCPRHDH